MHGCFPCLCIVKHTKPCLNMIGRNLSNQTNKQKLTYVRGTKHKAEIQNNYHQSKYMQIMPKSQSQQNSFCLVTQPSNMNGMFYQLYKYTCVSIYTITI